jgi:2-oxoisovalerate dehydrogenase E1 component
MKENIIKKALKIRKFEEFLLDCYSKGYLNGTVHTCIGQEITPVIVSNYMHKDDVVFSNHRGHGHYLSISQDYHGLLNEIMGKIEGCCGGYGGSQHTYIKNKFFSNGIQGGMTPIAVGYAHSLKQKLNKSISIIYIGDGTLGEGLLYESLNLASVYKAPVLFVLENNGIAQSTFFEENFRGNIKDRAQGFGLDYFFTDSRDFKSMNNTIENAIENARNNKPTFLEVKSYRLKSHSKGDDNRNDSIINEIHNDDLLSKELVKLKIKDNSEFDDYLNDLLDTAIKCKDLEDIENETLNIINNYNYSKISEFSNKRVNEQIYLSLKGILNNDDFIIVGEDIRNKYSSENKDYGGAFKVTKDLSDSFSERVMNMPISEGAIIGFSTGYALSGKSSISEIMFGDFMTLTFDQIYQHASKFQDMYNDEDLDICLTIRTPMGGKRGYGPTHSQSIEKYFLGINNFNVYVINHRLDIDKFYKKLTSVKFPKLIVENKILYNIIPQKQVIPSFYEIFESDCDYPVITIKPKNKFKAKLTILCYGGTLIDLEYALIEIFQELEILVEIVCFSCISPINNIKPLFDSVKATSNLLIIEEGPNYASFSSEIGAQILNNKLILNNFERISNNIIIPSSFKAESKLLINNDIVLETIKKMKL